MQEIYEPVLLQTSHCIINIVTGIINEPRKLWLPDIVEFALPPLEPENSSLFWLDASVDIALTDELYVKLIQPVYF